MTYYRVCFVIVGLLLCLSNVRWLSAQELRANVHISTEALGTIERSKYQTLEKQILNLLNETRWTNLSYLPNERIICTFALNILEVDQDIHHVGELSVTASRVAYGTTYRTTTYVFRDKDLNFDYSGGETLEYNPQNLDNALSATLALHAMLIIAIDLDSYLPLGGDLMKSAISELLSTASGQANWQGWRSFDSEQNRASLAEALYKVDVQPSRQAWYTYHRLGLDIASRKLDEARRNILNLLLGIKQWKANNFRSPLINLWESAKVDELTKLFAEAPEEERRKAYAILLDLFPTREDLFYALKR